MSKETNFQSKLIKYFENMGAFIIKYNASGISKTGVPDLLMCFNGQFIAIEVKAENGIISDIQQWNIHKIRKCKGIAFCVRPSDFDSIKKIIELNGDDMFDKIEKICKYNEKKIKEI